MTRQQEEKVSLRVVMKLAAKTMGKILATLPLVLVGLQCAAPQAKVAIAAQGIEAVSFCDLIRRSDEYNGKTVRVAGTYGHGPEGSSFVDHACDKFQSESRMAEADATFNGNDEGAVQAYKKVAKFLKKHRTTQAQVTVIAVFSDLEHPDVLLGYSRYKLDVKQVLSVERMNAPTKSNREP
jgi:hypothetical protein